MLKTIGEVLLFLSDNTQQQLLQEMCCSSFPSSCQLTSEFWKLPSFALPWLVQGLAGQDY